jgi:dephospho-CoA kinase
MTSDRPKSILNEPYSDHSPPQRIIGLTGGIGMGKTTVSNYLRDVHHLPILDADVYAREAVQPGSGVLQEIVERYGSRVLMPDGTLDRRQLGDIVFNSLSEKLWLEQRIHPYVRDRLLTELHHLNPAEYPIVVMVIPLLFEARMTDLVTEIWVVHCPADKQIERLLKRIDSGSRNSLTLKQIQARIDGQMAIEKKMRQADVVLHNHTTPDALYRQIDHTLYPTSLQTVNT